MSAPRPAPIEAVRATSRASLDRRNADAQAIFAEVTHAFAYGRPSEREQRRIVAFIHGLLVQAERRGAGQQRLADRAALSAAGAVSQDVPINAG